MWGKKRISPEAAEGKKELAKVNKRLDRVEVRLDYLTDKVSVIVHKDLRDSRAG